MDKYKVTINRIETYSYTVIVEADSPEKAKEAVDAKWQKDDYLYEKMTENWDDVQTTITDGVPATKEDLNQFPEIKN